MPVVLLYILILPFLWFSRNRRHSLIVMLLGFYAVYDLIDYSTIYFGVGFLAKILPEILLVGLCILYLLQIRKYSTCYAFRNLLFIAVLSFSVLAFAPLRGLNFTQEIGELRVIFRPILFFVLIRATCHFSRRQFHFIFQSFLFFSLIICLVGIYQYYTFDGDYTTVWRFDPLLDAKLEKNENFLEHLMEYQITRHDQLRASGPFYSALDFGYLAGLFAAVCCIYSIRMRGFANFIFWFIGTVVGLWACYVSCVRSAFVLFVLGIAYYTLITNFGVIKRWVHIAILIVSALSLFIVLGYFDSHVDLSALGRLRQLYYVASSFSPFGHGFASARFDSAFLYYINAMGILSLPLIYYVIRMLSPIQLLDDINGTVEGKMLYVSGLVFLFIMFFQFAIGSFVYNSIFILIACYLGVIEYDAKS